MPDLEIHRATTGDRELLERLWLMFAHDLSEHRQVLPFPDARFRDERLHAALDESDRCAWLLRLEGRPVGFALVRAVDSSPRVLASFFVVRGARRAGLGRAAVRAVVEHHRGGWEVAHQSANAAAAAFWPTIAAELDPHGWRQELRAVPERPDLAPDAWISFRTPDAAGADLRRGPRPSGPTRGSSGARAARTGTVTAASEVSRRRARGETLIPDTAREALQAAAVDHA